MALPGVFCPKTLYPPSPHHLALSACPPPAHLLHLCLIPTCWERKTSLVATDWFLPTNHHYYDGYWLICCQTANKYLSLVSLCLSPSIGTTQNSLCGIKIKPSKEWQSNPTIYLYIYSFLSIYLTFVSFSVSFSLRHQCQTHVLMLMAAWHFHISNVTHCSVSLTRDHFYFSCM